MPVDSALGRAVNGTTSTLEEIGFLTLGLLDRQWRTSLAAAGVKPHDIPPPIDFRPPPPAPAVPVAPKPPPTAEQLTDAFRTMLET